jgi:hypothetical protein
LIGGGSKFGWSTAFGRRFFPDDARLSELAFTMYWLRCLSGSGVGLLLLSGCSAHSLAHAPQNLAAPSPSSAEAEWTAKMVRPCAKSGKRMVC